MILQVTLSLVGYEKTMVIFTAEGIYGIFLKFLSACVEGFSVIMRLTLLGSSSICIKIATPAHKWGWYISHKKMCILDKFYGRLEKSFPFNSLQFSLRNVPHYFWFLGYGYCCMEFFWISDCFLWCGCLQKCFKHLHHLCFPQFITRY